MSRPDGGRMKRPTISDIARRAGVSKGAVSYALNGRPGVSAATRSRIEAIAAEMGWQPNSAARALSGAAAGAAGLVIARKARLLAYEPFFMELISGFETEFSAAGVGLLLQVVGEHPDAEPAVYRRWWGERRVDGVLLVDLLVDDPRPALLADLGLPAVALGRQPARPGATSVVIDASPAMEETIGYLAALGHRRIARVAGPEQYVHTAERTAAFLAAAQRHEVEPVTVTADYSGRDGARATRLLLAGRTRPTAIVYDNDVMAVAGLGVAQEMGLSVPASLSIVAWDDSPLCPLTRPSLTAVRQDVAGYGATCAAALMDLIAGKDVPDQQFPPPRLEPRGSTGRLGGT